MNPVIEQQFQTAKKIAFALIVGCLNLSVVFIFLLSQNADKAPVANWSMIQIISSILGATGLYASFVVKEFILRKKSEVIKISDEEKKKILMVVFISSFALCEFGILLCLVVAFISKSLVFLLVPLLIAAIGFYSHFPKKEEWEK